MDVSMHITSTGLSASWIHFSNLQAALQSDTEAKTIVSTVRVPRKGKKTEIHARQIRSWMDYEAY